MDDALSTEDQPDESMATTGLAELAALKPRYGYRWLHVLVLREKRRINHKWDYRLYTKLGLAVRRKKRKRVAQVNPCPRIVTAQANEQWSTDFLSDVLSNGRRLRTLNIVDDANRESLAIEVELLLSGIRFPPVLSEIGQMRPLPRRIVVENGPEVTTKAFDQRGYKNDVELTLTRPGKSVRNSFRQAFNGMFRNECLNLHRFPSLSDAGRKIDWLLFDYYYYRPHLSLGQEAPSRGRRAIRAPSGYAVLRPDYRPLRGARGRSALLIPKKWGARHVRIRYDAFAS